MIDPKDPNIIQLFKDHCLEGWSADSFAGKLKHRNKKAILANLINSNREFRKAYIRAVKKQKPMKRIVHLS